MTLYSMKHELQVINREIKEIAIGILNNPKNFLWGITGIVEKQNRYNWIREQLDIKRRFVAVRGVPRDGSKYKIHDMRTRSRGWVCFGYTKELPDGTQREITGAQSYICRKLMTGTSHSAN